MVNFSVLTNRLNVTDVRDLQIGAIEHRLQSLPTKEEIMAKGLLPSGPFRPNEAPKELNTQMRRQIGFKIEDVVPQITKQVSEMARALLKEINVKKSSKVGFTKELIKIGLKRFSGLLTMDALRTIAKETGTPTRILAKCLNGAMVNDPTKVAVTVAKGELAWRLRKPGQGRMPAAIREQLAYLKCTNGYI